MPDTHLRAREQDAPARADDTAGDDKSKRQLARDEDRDERPGPEEERARRRRRARSFIIAGIVLLILVIAGVLYWLHARHYESTDDAQIDGHRTQMAAQVSGRVKTLAIVDNQHVEAGQVLIEIDPRDYQARLDQAEAQEANAAASLAQAEAQIAVQRANLEQAKANAAVSEAELIQAQQDFHRYQTVSPAATSRQQVDNATATLRTSQARLEANRRATDAAEAQVVSAEAQRQAAEASLRQARANTEDARLQLSYATLTAPVAGRIATRTVEVGNYITPGQALFAIVEDRVWVTANFKETQLTDMRAGQEVRITVDAFPDVDFRGHVDSIQRGTGAVFSTLPAENATGNYVKVTQRVPVKIVFDDDRATQAMLSPGMSVEPRVTVR